MEVQLINGIEESNIYQGRVYGDDTDGHFYMEQCRVHLQFTYTESSIVPKIAFAIMYAC